MTPYFQDADITLYCGDMREIIPALGLKADAVITDPPYNETKLTWDRWPDGWPAVAASVAQQMWCFGTLRMFMDRAPELYANWKLSHDIIWEKQNGTGIRNDRFRRVHEQAAHFYQGEWRDVFKDPQYTHDATKRTIRRQTKPAHWGGIDGAVHKSEEGGPRLQTSVIYAKNCHGYAIHRTQKPEAIIRPILRYSVPPGGTVLDCFAGSGTTLIVAREFGMKAIGIEADEAACAGIVERLAQAILPLAQ